MHNRAMERSELCAELITATNSEVQLAPLLLAATGGACQLADCSHSLLCVPHRHCGARAYITQIDAHVCVRIDSIDPSTYLFIEIAECSHSMPCVPRACMRAARAGLKLRSGILHLCVFCTFRPCALPVASLPPSAFNLASFVLHPVCVLDVACGVPHAARFARRMVYVARSA